MKIGVRAHDFLRHDADTLARLITTAGFTTVQLAPTKALPDVNHYDDLTSARVTEIVAAFARHQLEVALLGCYIEPASPDETLRQDGLRQFSTALSMAKQFGCALVATETTHFDPAGTNAEREKAYARLLDSVLRMVEQAEQYDVNVGIEPVALHTLDTPKCTKHLIDTVNSPRLKVVFDPVNLLFSHTVSQQAAIYHELFDLCGERIAVLHMKDVVYENPAEFPQGNWRHLGEGVVDYQTIFTLLRAHGLTEIPLLREGAKPDATALDVATMKRLADGFC